MKKSKLFYEVVKSKMSFPAEILDKLFCSYEPEPHVVGLLEHEPYKKKEPEKMCFSGPLKMKIMRKFFKNFLKEPRNSLKSK